MAPTIFDHDAKPGDLIEISRGTYEHWAVYIGGNEVVHMIPPNDDLGHLGNLLMLLDGMRAQVRRQKIWEVVGSHGFHINNLLDDKYRPRNRHLIVRDACRRVGEELPYSVTTYNCEHFVTELRYGKAESRQVTNAVTVAAAAGVAGAGIVAFGAILASLLKDDDKRRHHK